MTGSSTENLTASALPHAASPQWLALVEAAASCEARFAAQPETWWSAQADRLRSDWMASGLPTMRLENWKYTSLVTLHEKSREITAANLELNSGSGVVLTRLSKVSSQVDETQLQSVRALLATSTDIEFADITRSFVSDPYIILVPEGFRSETPIEINWTGPTNVPGGPGVSWSFGVVAMFVGAGADVSIVESYGRGVGALSLVSLVDLKAHAKVGHLRLQCGVGSDAVIASTFANVEDSAVYEASQVSFGPELARENLRVELLGPSAQATVDGVYIGRGRQILDHHTDLVHRVGSTTSGQLYKGILSEESRGVFNGRIAIAKNASGSNSSQMNRNLLLSKKVEIDTKPQLEIENDDVKAAHGAAIGRLDPEHVFYLRSRGIELSQAVEILSRGFAFEGVARLSSSILRQRGTEAIEAGLRGLSWESL